MRIFHWIGVIVVQIVDWIGLGTVTLAFTVTLFKLISDGKVLKGIKEHISTKHDSLSKEHDSLSKEHRTLSKALEKVETAAISLGKEATISNTRLEVLLNQKDNNPQLAIGTILSMSERIIALEAENKELRLKLEMPVEKKRENPRERHLGMER